MTEDSRLLFEGKYEVLAKIREGGMGAVYEVRHRLLDEIRVVKVMRPGAHAEPEAERRFLEEARIATRLRHPNLCAIHDFAIDERGTAYLVMEHVDGVDLAEFVRSGRIPALELTLEIAHQALLALGYLHRKGIVHRDVAPDNLMLTYDEDRRPLVKLLDLGIARVVEGPADLTASGVFVGKPSYASPEQLGALPPGERIDSRSDLYALGVVLYELLTGRLPFRGASPAELLDAQRHITPFEESDPNGRVPADVRAVVLEALEPDREDRFDSADEFDRAVSDLQRRHGSRRPLEVTPEMVATAHGRDAAPDTAPDWARLDPTFGARRIAPQPPRVRSVDPDPLHTVRLPVDRPPAPSLESVPLIGGAAESGAEPRDAIDLARPGPPETRTPNRGVPARADMGVPLRRTRARRGPRWLELAAFAVAALAVLAVWWTWPSRQGRAARSQTPADTARAVAVSPARLQEVAVTPPPPSPVAEAPVQAASAEAASPSAVQPLAQAEVPVPTAAAPAEPTAQATTLAEARLPTPAPAAAPTRAAEHPPSLRDELERLSRETASARRSADEVRGRDFAPTTYGRAAAKQASAERLAARGSAAAAALFREAATLFARAAAVARETRRGQS